MRAIHPPTLRPGDRIAVTCPASPIDDKERFEFADTMRMLTDPEPDGLLAFDSLKVWRGGTT